MPKLNELEKKLEVAKKNNDEDYLDLAEKFNTILKLQVAFENIYSEPVLHDFEGISVSEIISALHHVRKNYLEKELDIL